MPMLVCKNEAMGGLLSTAELSEFLSHKNDGFAPSTPSDHVISLTHPPDLHHSSPRPLTPESLPTWLNVLHPFLIHVYIYSYICTYIYMCTYTSPLRTYQGWAQAP